MISELVLNVITVVAGGLTASSLYYAITKVLHKHTSIKEKEYKIKLKKLEVELNKQLLELEEMQRQIEAEEIENREKYDETKALINNLIEQYKKQEQYEKR